MYCRFKECCTPRWVNHTDAMNIPKTFKQQLIGQHLVERIAANTVIAHLKKEEPEKALVLSFHGWTGSGKNFVSDIIASHVYKNGVKSKFVHKYIAGNDFQHLDELQDYKERLKKEITEKTNMCERSLFVFDETEKMPEGLLDTLKPFLDHHPHIKGVDYRKNIFIFLSNTGGDEVNREVYDHFKSGEPREMITAKQMESVLSMSSFNLEGGLKNSILVVSELVDFYVPFLPMELDHVKQCIRAEMKKRGHAMDEKIVKDVASEIDFFPKRDPIFSNSGCKKVSKKLDAYL